MVKMEINLFSIIIVILVVVVVVFRTVSSYFV